ncbi:MAG: hypothetical protein KC466_06940, partial [Myxococcales bacterium]|nr:hypothetical protein [Myxococcales bacterium]
MRVRFAWVVAALSAAACNGSGGSHRSADLGPPALRTFTDYDVPVADTSPWPMMRRNRLQNGRSPVMPTSRPGREPWRFQTGKGIFSV